jgi:hypothetical protein
MIERGIWNTKADFWVHLFPMQRVLYWYSVRHMQEYLKDEKHINFIDGHSKDGAVTGRGFLVRRDAPFIEKVDVPQAMVSAFDWESGNDRQVGLIWGETVLDWMATTNRLRIPFFTASRLSSRKDQFELGDFGVQFHMPTMQVAEVKTERVKSENLFIQTHEKGHRVCLSKDRMGNVTHTPTAAPGFSDKGAK